MKLGSLRSAIRNSKAGVTMDVPLPNGTVMRAWLVKGTLLDELGRCYGDNKAAETDLEIDEMGHITPTGQLDIEDAIAARKAVPPAMGIDLLPTVQDRTEATWRLPDSFPKAVDSFDDLLG